MFVLYYSISEIPIIRRRQAHQLYNRRGRGFVHARILVARSVLVAKSGGETKHGCQLLVGHDTCITIMVATTPLEDSPKASQRIWRTLPIISCSYTFSRAAVWH